MLEYMTGDSVFSQALMEEPQPQAMLLVEGPDEDTILFEHLTEGVVRIVAGNKKAVLDASELAIENGRKNVFGLVDRDFDSLLGKDTYPPNVVATDAYDLVADLLQVAGHSELRRIMIAHGVKAVRASEQSTGRSVDDIVFELTGPLAAVRLAALRYGYPLICKNYDFKRTVIGSFVAADVGVYARNTHRKRPEFLIDESVLRKIRDLLPEVSDRRFIGGHDLVAATVAVMALGGVSVSKSAIEGSFNLLAVCDSLGSIACLQQLNKIAMDVAGTHLIDCGTAYRVFV